MKSRHGRIVSLNQNDSSKLIPTNTKHAKTGISQKGFEEETFSKCTYFDVHWLLKRGMSIAT